MQVQWPALPRGERDSGAPDSASHAGRHQRRRRRQRTRSAQAAADAAHWVRVLVSRDALSDEHQQQQQQQQQQRMLDACAVRGSDGAARWWDVLARALPAGNSGARVHAVYTRVPAREIDALAWLRWSDARAARASIERFSQASPFVMSASADDSVAALRVWFAPLGDGVHAPLALDHSSGAQAGAPRVIVEWAACASGAATPVASLRVTAASTPRTASANTQTSEAPVAAPAMPAPVDAPVPTASALANAHVHAHAHAPLAGVHFVDERRAQAVLRAPVGHARRASLDAGAPLSDTDDASAARNARRTPVSVSSVSAHEAGGALSDLSAVQSDDDSDVVASSLEAGTRMDDELVRRAAAPTAASSSAMSGGGASSRPSRSMSAQRRLQFAEPAAPRLPSPSPSRALAVPRATSIVGPLSLSASPTAGGVLATSPQRSASRSRAAAGSAAPSVLVRSAPTPFSLGDARSKRLSWPQQQQPHSLVQPLTVRGGSAGVGAGAVAGAGAAGRRAVSALSLALRRSSVQDGAHESGGTGSDADVDDERVDERVAGASGSAGHRVPISELPDDIVELILGELDMYELMDAELVCRLWLRLAQWRWRALAIARAPADASLSRVGTNWRRRFLLGAAVRYDARAAAAGFEVSGDGLRVRKTAPHDATSASAEGSEAETVFGQQALSVTERSYFEVRVREGFKVMLGLAPLEAAAKNAKQRQRTHVSEVPSSVAFFSRGQLYESGHPCKVGVSWRRGDRVGCLVDPRARSVSFLVNGFVAASATLATTALPVVPALSMEATNDMVDVVIGARPHAAGR